MMPATKAVWATLCTLFGFGIGCVVQEHWDTVGPWVVPGLAIGGVWFFWWAIFLPAAESNPDDWPY